MADMPLPKKSHHAPHKQTIAPPPVAEAPTASCNAIEGMAAGASRILPEAITAIGGAAALISGGRVGMDMYQGGQEASAALDRCTSSSTAAKVGGFVGEIAVGGAMGGGVGAAKTAAGIAASESGLTERVTRGVKSAFDGPG
jgi:hypothetical protein